MRLPCPPNICFSIENVTIYFLKDITARKKLYVHNTRIKSLYVPMYKNLSLERIFEFVNGQPEVTQYFPDQEDLPKIPKQWIVNVCAAVIGEPFKNWVSE